MNTPLAPVSATGGMARRGLAITSFVYLVVTMIACGVLICIDVGGPLLFWKTFQFYRFMLVALGILVGAVSYQAAASACEGCLSSPPSLMPVIVVAVYELWSLVALCFFINDLVHCSTTAWCHSPFSLHISGYFLAFFIALCLQVIVAVVLIYFNAALYFRRQALCVAAVCAPPASVLSEMPAPRTISRIGRYPAGHRLGLELTLFEPAMKAATSSSSSSQKSV